MKNRKIILILPSFNESGGKKIAEEFAFSLDKNYSKIFIFKNTKTNFIFLFFIYFYRLIYIANSLLRKNQNSTFILTHYSTLPLRIVPFLNFRYFYQDHEYKFVSNYFFSFLIKVLISLVATFTQTTSTSKFLNPPYIFKKRNHSIFPIWINTVNPKFQPVKEKLNQLESKKVILVLRPGNHKNALFTERVANQLSIEENLEISVLLFRYKPVIISNNKKIKIFHQMSFEALINLYQENSYFIYLSLEEGFGLMPLEAMFYSCQPILFKNTGTKNYIPNNLEDHFYIKRGSLKQVILEIKSILNTPKFSSEMLENIARSVSL